MGGKGSGGRRVGAGRKPKTAREHWLSGDAGRRGLALVERPEDAGVPESSRRRGRRAKASREIAAGLILGPAGEVPAMLTDEERAWWVELAPRAIANGTLTEDTRPGFVVLCQTAADAAEIRRDIRERGILTERKAIVGDAEDAVVETLDLKAHPLWPSYRGLQARLEQLMARYGLAASGTANEGGKPKEDDERAELRRLLAIS
jgi:hypothetical protein